MERWISALWTGRLIAEAAKRGVDAARLWSLVGLAPGTPNPEVRLADNQHLTIWEEVMRALHDPAFPIDFAETMRIDDYDVLGLACKTSADLREAVERLSRYLTIWTNTFRFQITTESEPVRLVLERTGAATLGRRCSTESGVAELLWGLRSVAGEPLVPTGVHFRHRAPDAIERHEEFFGRPPKFDSDYDGFELDPRALETPLPLADEGLSRFFQRHLESQEQVRTTTDLLDDVTDAISRELPSGNPPIAKVAARLGVSTRTLQRRLADAEASFQDLVTQTRRRLAEQLLAGTDHTVAEIAFLLGFSEPSALHRAFRRWTGQTPGAYRAAARS